MNPRTDLPACVVCGRACIPLADYDAPTCIACDAAVVAILDASSAADTVTTPRPRPTDLDGLPLVVGCGTPSGYLDHIEAGDLPCEPCAHYYRIAAENVAAWRAARERVDLTGAAA